MGLDITVSRLGKRADLKSGKIYSFSMYKIDDTNNVVFDDGDFPKWALNLVEYSDVEFYDFEKYRIMTGIDVNDYKRGTFKFSLLVCALVRFQYDGIESEMLEIQISVSRHRETLASSFYVIQESTENP